MGRNRMDVQERDHGSTRRKNRGGKVEHSGLQMNVEL